MPLSTTQAFSIGVITGLLSRTYAHLLGTLAMTSWFLMLKKILLAILHTSFFTAKFKFFQRLPEILMVVQEGFVIVDMVYGCDNCTYNPSAVQELSLLTKFLSIKTLQLIVSEKQCKGGLTKHGVLSMRSNDLTYNLSLSKVPVTRV